MNLGTIAGAGHKWRSYGLGRAGTRDHQTVWFSDVVPLVVPVGGRGSHVDAAILQGIEHGMARAEGLPTNRTNPGGPRWEKFFLAARSAGPRPDDSEVARLRGLWGPAEQASTDRGLRVAQNIHCLKPGDREKFLLVDIGNFYRKAVADPSVAVAKLVPLMAQECAIGGEVPAMSPSCTKNFVERIEWDFDPRNPTAVYQNAREFWWTPGAVRKGIEWYL